MPGTGITRPETPRCPGAEEGSGTHHSVAPRVGALRFARQRNLGAAGCTAEVGRGDPAVPAAGGAGEGAGGRAWEDPGDSGGSAGAVPVPVSGLGDQSLEVPGRSTPFVTRRGDPLPVLPRGRGTKTGKKKKLKETKLLVALQNRVHRVSGQEPSLAFAVRSPQYCRNRDPSGRAGAARRTCQSHPHTLPPAVQSTA